MDENEVLTLNALEELFRKCARKATPHRTPNFTVIRELADGDNPEVKGSMIFLEEHNTGHKGGLLERWRFYVAAKDGGQPVMFMADMLPGQITNDRE